MSAVDEKFFTSLNAEEQELLCSVINNFGDGQHPMADKKGLKYFRLPYVLHCLGRSHERAVNVKTMDTWMKGLNDTILDKARDALDT